MSDQEFREEFDSFIKKISGCKAEDRVKMLTTIKGLLAGMTITAPPRVEEKAPEVKTEAAPAPEPAAAPAETPAATAATDPKAQSVTGSKYSVRTTHAPGGNSSLVLGDALSGLPNTPTAETSGRKHFDNKSNKGSGSEEKQGSHARKILQPTGGRTNIVIGDGTGAAAPHTSVRTSQAPGGNSSIVLGGPEKAEEKKAAAAKEESKEFTAAELKEIARAINAKGKTKDTFQKWTGMKAKTLSAEDIKLGFASLGFPTSDAQANYVLTKYAKNPKEGLMFNDFVKFLSN